MNFLDALMNRKRNFPADYLASDRVGSARLGSSPQTSTLSDFSTRPFRGRMENTTRDPMVPKVTSLSATPTIPAGGGYEAIGRMQPDGSVMGPADYAAKGLIWNPAPAESFTAAPYPDWERDVANGVTTNWGSYTPPASYVAWQAEQQKQAEQQRLGDTSGQSSAISWNSPFASDEQMRMLVDALMKLKLGG